LIFVCLTACLREASFGETIIPYYPPEDILREGYVNKYYLNAEELENNIKSTNVIYEKVQLVDSILQLTQLSSGFNERRLSHYLVKVDGLELKEEWIYYAKDTAKSIIHKSQELFWNNEKAEKQYSRSFDGYYSQEISTSKQYLKDTIWENKTARVYSFSSTENRIYEKADQGEKSFEENGHLIIAEGIGAVSFYTEDSLSKSEKLLVEQMSMKEFELRANHGTHRVAYIDSSSTLDVARKDLLCDDQDNIFDYYNSPTPAGFHDGKGPLKKFVFDKLDQSKIAKESGFLTFRFVINCKGEAGWFTLEQADLDYQKKEFNQKTISHLLDILQSVPSWNHAVINEKDGDAYAYITFKLRDGEIFEILP